MLESLHKVTPHHMCRLYGTLMQDMKVDFAGLPVVASYSWSASVYLAVNVGVRYVCVYSTCVGVWLHPHASEPEEKTVFRACSPLL